MTLDQPVAHLAEQCDGVVHHRVLDGRGDAVVELLDRPPQLAHVEGLARHGVGPRHGRRVRTRVLLRAGHEVRAHAIDDAVGGRRRDDLALESMLAQEIGIASREAVREIAVELTREVAVLRNIGLDELVVERDLGVGEHHGQFRPRETLAGAAPVLDLLGGRQVLECAIQHAVAAPASGSGARAHRAGPPPSPAAG